MARLNTFQRSKQVAEVLLKYGLDDFFERSSLKKWLPESLASKLIDDPARNISVYERIRRALEELGTTYVKLGQMLSDRRDLLPPEMIAELQKLQNKVEIQPLDIKEKFKRELDIDTGEHFESLAGEPLASASIGQVFKGRLKNGRDVAVKIKREGIDETVRTDLQILHELVGFVETRNELVRNLQPQILLAAFENSINEELSLDSERRSIERFARCFAEDVRLTVAQTYPQLSNDNILCMDFIHGSKVTDKVQIEKLGLSAQDVAVTGLDLYMKQIFEHGFFHADPHPGNILLTDGGKLAFIDLGAMGTLLPPERELLSDCLVYASQKNVKKLIAALKNLAVSYRVEDEKTLERQLGEILETVGGSSLNGLDVGDLMQRFTRILSQNSIAMPEGVYLLAKGIAQIEGIGRHLHPELDIAAVLRPYVTDIIKRKLSPKRLISEGFGRLSDSYDSFLALPEELKNFLHKISNKEIRLEHELHRLDDIRNSFERVGLMLIIAALIIAASVLSLNDKPPQLYGFPLPSLICFAIAALLALWLALKRK